ncbi:MAG: hypothetical protein MSS84_06445 [Bacteroidales bacterium]|nr:hypothetical protein [Bacteroidales bacterium]
MGILRSLKELINKPTLDGLVTSLENNIIIKVSQYTTEKNVENVIAKQLKEQYGIVHQQYNIGGFLGLKCDIDLYNGKFGIELKLAKELLKNATNIERLLGQAIYYNHRCYNGNLIILVVGRKKDCTPQMKEIKSLIEELGVKFVFNCID